MKNPRNNAQAICMRSTPNCRRVGTGSRVPDTEPVTPGYGYVYGERGVMLPIDTFESKAEVHARPGYEIRTLMASAHITAQRGQQAACEALLAETRDIYKDYAANLDKTGVAKADMSGWQNHLIAAAQPVTSSAASFRSIN